MINVTSAVVALFHFYFLYLEMFLWDTDKGRKAFKMTAEFSKQSRVLAANQGLYNGFLAIGIVWGLLKINYENADCGSEILKFFLGCVIVAGVYGGFTVSMKIMILQTLPALIAFAFLSLA